MADQFRIERDSMGEMRVPANAYYGAQTARAVDNFPISSLRFSRGFIAALGYVKAAAARANVQLKLLDARRGKAIEQAAREVAEGKLDGEFVVDVFQTGSGTSTNMNANEVIANRAIEILGGTRGDTSLVHPNDHVNMGQSTNDVFPTAHARRRARSASRPSVLPGLRALGGSLRGAGRTASRRGQGGAHAPARRLPITWVRSSPDTYVINHGILIPRDPPSSPEHRTLARLKKKKKKKKCVV